MLRLVFCLFLLLFFRYAQGDVVCYLESLCLQRPAEPHPWLSAIGLTAVMMCAGWVGQKCLTRHGRRSDGVYVFVGWLAAALVSLPFASWIYQAALFAVAVALYGCFGWWERRNDRRWGERRTLWQSFIPATVQLLLVCLYTALGAAATDVEHYELRTAEAIRTERPKRAYKAGERSLATSPRLFAMRCYLMAKTDRHGLGNEIFKQPVPAGGSAHLLFPDDARQRLILSPDTLYRLLGSTPRTGEDRYAFLRRCATEAAERAPMTTRPSAPVDYYLCALLLDRRLDEFAREVTRLYPAMVMKGKLPAFFAHALVYYDLHTTQPAPLYRDAAIEANYHDYTRMVDSITDLRQRANLLRRSYGETYWWWYEYGLKSPSLLQ